MNRIETLENIVENVEKVIIDKRYEIEMTLVTLLCRGHMLIEDVPGVGKTSLATALAKSLGCSFKRVQFTPDIMLAVHEKGIGSCGVYTEEVAETKVMQVHDKARRAGFPLRCSMEEE